MAPQTGQLTTQESLVQAAREGDLDLMRTLLSHSDVNIDFQMPDGGTALHAAVAAEQIDAVQLLLEKGADIRVFNKDGLNPFHVGVLTYNENLVRILVEEGLLPRDLNVDILMRDGRTSFQLLIAQTNQVAGRYNMLRQLHGYDANVSVKTIDLHAPKVPAAFHDWTPLHYGLARRDLVLVEMLLDMGADIEAPAYHKGGRSLNALGNDLRPLHIAAYYGDQRLVNRLCDHSTPAQLESWTSHGYSPLRVAVIRANRLSEDESGEADGVVTALVARGASIEAKKTLCRSPWEAANERVRGVITRAQAARTAATVTATASSPAPAVPAAPAVTVAPAPAAPASDASDSGDETPQSGLAGLVAKAKGLQREVGELTQASTAFYIDPEDFEDGPATGSTAGEPAELSVSDDSEGENSDDDAAAAPAAEAESAGRERFGIFGRAKRAAKQRFFGKSAEVSPVSDEDADSDVSAEADGPSLGQAA